MSSMGFNRRYPFCQSGFSLVAAIFLVVVVSLIGVFIVTISGVQRSTVTLSMQSARAYQAARSGIEWAASSAVTNNACPASAVFPAVSFVLNTPSIGSFNVSVSCVPYPQSEFGSNFNVFAITSTAWPTASVWGQADFVQRRVQATVTNAPPPP